MGGKESKQTKQTKTGDSNEISSLIFLNKQQENCLIFLKNKEKGFLLSLTCDDVLFQARGEGYAVGILYRGVLHCG